MHFPKLLFLPFLLLTACGEKSETQTPAAPKEEPASHAAPAFDESAAVKLYLRANGTLTADGKVVTLEEAGKALDEVKSRNGVVFYSRDNNHGEPHENAIKLMDLVMSKGLPLRFYTDSTFTEVFKPQ